jgi:hypothetical protein
VYIFQKKAPQGELSTNVTSGNIYEKGDEKKEENEKGKGRMRKDQGECRFERVPEMYTESNQTKTNRRCEQ